MAEEYKPGEEQLFDLKSQLTPEQLELSKECELRFLDDDNKTIIGKINGSGVFLTIDGKNSRMDGVVIDDEDEAKAMYSKYLKIATLQDTEPIATQGA